MRRRRSSLVGEDRRRERQKQIHHLQQSHVRETICRGFLEL
jgi:hypothetical protein